MSDLSQRAYEMKFRGVTNENIAKAFQLKSNEEVNKLVNQFKQEVKQCLHAKTIEEFTFDHYLGLGTLRNMALAKFHEIDLNKVTILPDGTTQKDICCDYPAQAHFLQIALDAQKYLEGMTSKLDEEFSKDTI